VIQVLARKLVQLVVVLFVVTFLSFLLVNLLPGKPQDVLVPFSTSGYSDAQIAQILQKQKLFEEGKGPAPTSAESNIVTVVRERNAVSKDLGLDRPLPAQYIHWVNGLVHGNFGYYYRVNNKQPVSDTLKHAVTVSLELMVLAQVLALVFAIPLGVYTAFRAGKPDDRVASSVAYLALALPNFVAGLVLSYYVGVKLGWLPPNYVTSSPTYLVPLKYMVLPAISLALAQIAIYMRLLRSDMIQTLQEDFVLVAKAKGLTSRRVLWRHALRPSSLTLLTIAGLNVGTLIGGAVVLEVIFNLPGMGTMMFAAINARQYVALQSAIVIIAAGYVIANFLVDLLYTVLDPRIRSVRAAH
jgi:peptide/nickel transport system permease protein